MNEWDFEPLESLMGKIDQLAPGDILFLRPSKVTPEFELQNLKARVLEILPRGAKAMFIPFDWEVGVARPIQDEAIVNRLQRMVEDLNG